MQTLSIYATLFLYTFWRVLPVMAAVSLGYFIADFQKGLSFWIIFGPLIVFAFYLINVAHSIYRMENTKKLLRSSKSHMRKVRALFLYKYHM